MTLLIRLGFLLLVTLSASCSVLHEQPSTPLHQSTQYYNYLQSDFTSYVDVTNTWLKNNRSFISDNHSQELSMNAPFLLKHPNGSDKAALLVHGLADSPYSFSDIAQTLYLQGFDVHVLLLPGHGSKPDDLMLPNYQDWQTIVDHYALQLKHSYSHLWLGGFSTGGNLVTIHALEKDGIDGLLLFSPGFQSRTPVLEKLAPLAAVFTDGYRAKERNLARYTSAPLNGAIAYSQSASRLRKLIADKPVDIPTLITMSELDSVVDPEAIETLFQERFTHQASQLIWYGEKHSVDNRVIPLTMKLPQAQISSGSHMSPLFAPSNTYYGTHGQHRMCINGFDKQAVASCEAGANVWFAAWGYEEEGKIHARLTWNPYYAVLEKDIEQITAQ